MVRGDMHSYLAMSSGRRQKQRTSAEDVSNSVFNIAWNNIQEIVSSISEEDITRHWIPRQPLVSVLITSYNHAAYIADAIAGALAQRSTYPFEIIIRDDGSTDETPAIVSAFASRLPIIIRPVLLERNSGLRTRADQEIKKHAKGDFLALCDGDDFWLREDKIQLQADVLMNHQDVALVHHMSLTVIEGSRNLGRMRPGVAFRHHFSSDELARAPKISKSTVMYRNLPIPQVNYSRDIAPSMDIMTFQLLSGWGGAYFLADFVGSCKRLHGSNSSSDRPELQRQISPQLSRIFLGEINQSSGKQAQAVQLAFEGARGLLASLFRWRLVSPIQIGLWALGYGIYRALRSLFRVQE